MYLYDIYKLVRNSKVLGRSKQNHIGFRRKFVKTIVIIAHSDRYDLGSYAMFRFNVRLADALPARYLELVHSLNVTHRSLAHAHTVTLTSAHFA